MNRKLLCRVLGVVLVGMLAAAEAAAQESAARAGAEPAGDEVAKEQSIYIPYKELRRVFEKQKRGVFLPYEEFMALWRKARAQGLEPADAKPPVDFLITEAENAASVARDSDVVAVRSTLKVEILKAGWNQVPLRLSDAAVTRATLDKKPARLVFDAAAGYSLLLKKEGDKPQLFTVELEFAKAYTKAPGQNSVSFESPQAPVSRWQIQIPDTGVKVNIEPMIAATELPGGEKDAGTSVLAFVGAAPTVRIGWTPKAEGATGLAALASVEAEHRVTVEEGVVRSRTELVYAISRAELPALKIEVPADQKVVNVFDPNVRQWSLAAAAEAGGPQVIEAQLFEPAKQSQRLVVELEKYDDKADGDKVRQVGVPIVQAVGVIRQQGTVVVRVADDLRAEATERSGLMQVDVSELPASLRRGKWDFAYRYAVLPFGLTLRVERIQPRITVESLAEARLRPDELLVDLLAVYTIERAGVFQLAVVWPDGYEVRQVRGLEAAGAGAVEVDSYHVEGDATRRLVVDLSRKAMGRLALAVTLSRRLSEADLLTPTGTEVEVPLAVPRVDPATVERENGRLVVYAPETLRVNARTEGLRNIDVSKALELVGGASPFARAGVAERPVMAYAYSEEKADATLLAERRAPQVTVRQLVAARVETGVIKYTATFFYDVRYGTVKSVRIDVPAELAEAKKIRNVTAGVREEQISPPPEDLDAGYVAWRLSGEKEFGGRSTITLKWETPIEDLDIGKSVDIAVPHLKPRDGRAWGQIVLAKVETIDLQPVNLPDALRPIDPQHDLMAGSDVTDGAWAFEFHADWTLTVRATRYEHEEVKHASISRALVRTVVTRSGDVSVQALLRLRSARQRLQMELPADVEFDDRPLRINGQAEPLEHGDRATHRYFIPLAKQQAADKDCLVELRYTVKDVGLAAPRIAVPVFPDEPAVQQVFLSVYLPEARTWLGAVGPWTDQQVWRWRGLSYVPRPRMGENQLIAWVTQGTEGAAKPGETFQVDGKRYLFSAVRPAGALRVVSMDATWLKAIVFIVIVLGGLVLLPCSVSRRWLAVGALVVAIVLLAVFLPTPARQLAGGVTLAALVIVFVVWVLRYVLVTRPRRKPTAPPSTPPQPGPQPVPAAEGGDTHA